MKVTLIPSIGDRVAIKTKTEFDYTEHRLTEVGVVELNRAGADYTWRAVRWPNGDLRGAKACDLIVVERPLSKTWQDDWM